MDDALDRGEIEDALRMARESLQQQPDAEGWYLLGASLLAAGEHQQGSEALESAVELDESHTDAWIALAEESLSVLDFDEAEVFVHRALRCDPSHPVARRLRAGLRERRLDFDGAARDYLTAALADPEGYPVPVALTDEMIEGITESVLGSLHPSLRAYLANVPILVEESPDREVLLELEEAHPFELVGCFTGRRIYEREGVGSWNALPPTITIYRRNLSRLAHDDEELQRELRVTLLHEIGHYLGLDEEDLASRGLD